MALLNLTNFDDHPTEPTWMVFRFGDRDMGREFMEGLDAAGIPYEANEEDEGMRLIGVKQRYRDAAVKINYTVLGRHREPFIGDGYFRWALIGSTVVLLVLALIGAVLN